MTQDEIIEMAKLVIGNYAHEQYWPFFTEELEHFAKLVAAKEREQIIAITETQEFSRMYGEFTPSAYDLVKAIRARGEA